MPIAVVAGLTLDRGSDHLHWANQIRSDTLTAFKFDIPMNEELITPKVNNEAEFLEIVNDFGDPLELIREAISNAFDHGARNMKISCTTEPIDGDDKLVITLVDDGTGMTRDVLRDAFWGTWKFYI